VPLDEGFRLDDDQGTAPVEEACQREQGHADSGTGRSRPDLALLEQCELLAKEEVLGDERSAAGEERSEQGEQSPFSQFGSPDGGEWANREFRESWRKL